MKLGDPIATLRAHSRRHGSIDYEIMVYAKGEETMSAVHNL